MNLVMDSIGYLWEYKEEEDWFLCQSEWPSGLVGYNTDLGPQVHRKNPGSNPAGDKILKSSKKTPKSYDLGGSGSHRVSNIRDKTLIGQEFF